MKQWIKYQWDRSTAVALAVLGSISILLGWIGISGATLVTEQLPYLASGGIGGVFLLGAAGTLWLSADLRDEWRKLEDIHARLEHVQGPAEVGRADGDGKGSAR